MKFTREEAYKELVAKLTPNGEALNLSERSINEQIETLLPLVANEETELNDFVSKVLPLVKTADSNVRRDVSVGITRYKEEHPVQQANPTSTQNHNVEDEKLSAYIKKVEELEARFAREEETKVISSIKKDLMAKLQEKGVKDTDWINSLIQEIDVTKDFKVEDKLDAYVKLYNKSNAITPPSVTPRGGGGNEDVAKYISDIIAEAGKL